MTTSLTYIVTGFLLGLTGLIPGPLLTLVISETLKQGTKAGIKVALSPLITDFPIILVTILVMFRITDTDYIMGVIAFGGSIYLLYLAFESFSFKGAGSEKNLQANVIKKGIIANFLNPSPYIFWLTIGAPAIIKAFSEGFLNAVLFIVVFYSVLVGSKVAVAVITGKVKNLLSSKYYLYLVRFLGIALLLFAIYFVKNGLLYFDAI